jgi:hypothetical protein
LPKPKAREVCDTLKALNLIPADAFLSSGEKFDGRFWSIDNKFVSNRVALPQYTQFRPSSEFWSYALANGSTKFPVLSYNSQVGGMAGDLAELFNKPATNGVSVGRLPAGVPVKVSRGVGDWKKVSSLSGVTGWVKTKIVAKTTVVSNDNNEGYENDTDENRPLDATPAEQHRNALARQKAEILLSDLVLFLKDHPDFPEIAELAARSACAR